MKEAFRTVAMAGVMLVGGVGVCAAVAYKGMLIGAGGDASMMAGLFAGVVTQGAIAYYGIFKDYSPKVS